MTDLEKMMKWLKSFPRWQETDIFVDHTDAAPVNGGLFPQGVQETGRTGDVLGNATVRCRQVFVLNRVVTRLDGPDAEAQWMMDFQDWVREQSLAGLAPVFGDEPTAERMRAEKGRLLKAERSGTLVYTVTLTAEFIKKYEVN